MKRNRFPATLLGTILAILGLAGANSLQAQSSVRPGSSSSSSLNRSSSSGGGVGGGSSSSASSTGPRQYRSHTLLGDAIIQIDPETRSLIIVTDDETEAELAKVIKELDRPKPQVLIKVVFLEVTYNNESDIGVEGSYTFNLKSPGAAAAASALSTTTTNVTNAATSTTVNGITTATGPTSQTTTTTAPNTATTATGPATGLNTGLGQTVNLASSYGLAALTQGNFVRLASDNWSATLSALNTYGKTEVLSRPSIMARNNQQAVIIVGSEVPFVSNSRVTDTGETINSVTYDNVGIILTVTPFITNNNQVEMIVAPEISALTSQSIAISNTATSPVISKRSAETVVVVPDGTTSVIGGLMQTQKTSTVQKVPYLGDIPGLGFFFKNTVKNLTKTELLIFLTPYIVRTDEDLQNETDDEANRTSLGKKAFSEKELDEYLRSTKVNTTSHTKVVTGSSQPFQTQPQPEVRRATLVANPATPAKQPKPKTKPKDQKQPPADSSN